MAETKRDFSADRTMCDAATPGPWRRKHGNIYVDNEMVMRLPPSPRGYGGGDASDYLEVRDANSVFIAEARSGWPAALDEIVRLRRGYDKLRAYVERQAGEGWSAPDALLNEIDAEEALDDGGE